MSKTKNTTIGFIGGGVMARALINGLISAKIFKPSQIWVSDKDAEKGNELQKTFSVNFVDSNKQCVRHGDIVILAVKPQDVESVFTEIGGAIKKEKLMISIVAGLTIESMRQYLMVPSNENSRLVRVMPNTPARIGCGMTVIYNSSPYPEDKECAKDIFESVGEVLFLAKESLLNSATGLSGSGPAFTFLFIDALATGGVLEGLNRKDAIRSAAMTVYGAAKMVLDQNKHPSVLRDEVTSPGGTAIEGVVYLEENQVVGKVANAVRVASQKSIQLAEVNVKKIGKNE